MQIETADTNTLAFDTYLPTSVGNIVCSFECELRFEDLRPADNMRCSTKLAAELVSGEPSVELSLELLSDELDGQSMSIVDAIADAVLLMPIAAPEPESAARI